MIHERVFANTKVDIGSSFKILDKTSLIFSVGIQEVALTLLLRFHLDKIKLFRLFVLIKLEFIK